MTDASTREQALATAARAADLAGVQVVELHDHADMPAVSGLFDAVWGRAGDAGAIMAPEALTALAHAGAQVSGAYRDGALVGATAAFLGLADDGEVFLHSHVTGVVAGAAGRGVGRALKWHQRAWCLQRGIGRVRWTFDPLVRRNAVFNLVLLGARVVAYREDVYGRMQDARNAGAPTDRLVTDWDLTAPRVLAAAADRAAAPDVAAMHRAGAATLLRVDDDETPHLTPTDAPRVLVQVPADIEAIRQRDPDLGNAWAAAIRATLGHALQQGMRVSGCSRDGWYVLAADRSVTELAERS
ncbi:GNAT family N-acetyltransferase [Egicoccus sp. AB-alg6-2]|uniref:GNAT family N-acetyltransferase n=1 Tax=Egicoccus sp. AB-alg6-2 TaxID=3242692 RepID=UPI00359E2393